MDKNPGSATVKTPSSNFTGDVWMNPVFGGDGTSQLTCGFVRFTPGARTNWHSHVGAHAGEGSGLDDALDAAYRGKYGRLSSAVVRITADVARATTLRVDPA